MRSHQDEALPQRAGRLARAPRPGANARSRASLDSGEILRLQRAAGNRATTAMLKQPGAAAQRILTKDAPPDSPFGTPSTMVSTFDKTTVIDATHAAITVSARDQAGWGGHAEIYLEMIDSGTPTEYFVDMIGVNDAKILVRIKTLKPGDMNLRGGGGYTTHSISTTQADQALVEAAYLRGQAEYGTIKYEYYGPKLWNLNPFDPVKYMNCADFCEKVLNAAGVAVSTGLLSIPKTIANAK